MATVLTISYERVFNLGNYENHRIGVTVQVDDGDIGTAQRLARSIVELEHQRYLDDREAAERERRAAWERRREEEQRRALREPETDDDPKF